MDHRLTLPLLSSKSTFSHHLSKNKCISDVVRIGSITIFYLSNSIHRMETDDVDRGTLEELGLGDEGTTVSEHGVPITLRMGL